MKKRKLSRKVYPAYFHTPGKSLCEVIVGFLAGFGKLQKLSHTHWAEYVCVGIASDVFDHPTSTVDEAHGHLTRT